MANFFGLRRPRDKPSLPDGVRIYAVGDIHGRADLLGDVLTRIDLDLRRDPSRQSIEVFLGDYVDRGPHSRMTLQMLIERGRARETIFLMGNHEAVLIDLIKNPGQSQDWNSFGLMQTLMSYDIKPSLSPSTEERSDLIKKLIEAMPLDHLTFLNELRKSYTCGDFFFVHAGVRPGVSFAEQDEADLLWIREEFLESRQHFEKYVIHGHTPVTVPDIRPNRMNIDTGAYASGKLTLLKIEASELLVLDV